MLNRKKKSCINKCKYCYFQLWLLVNVTSPCLLFKEQIRCESLLKFISLSGSPHPCSMGVFGCLLGFWIAVIYGLVLRWSLVTGGMATEP